MSDIDDAIVSNAQTRAAQIKRDAEFGKYLDWLGKMIAEGEVSDEDDEDLAEPEPSSKNLLDSP
jgi:hypothetical protein